MALTPYMSLDLPVPTVTLGPEWAEQLNAALEFIDAHDHTSGKGRLITAAALNINDDVAINSNNLVGARSYNMQNLGTPIGDPSDLRSIYAVNGELYFNDGSGNQVQITDSGGINASTIGGIGGDYAPPAAVNYNSISKSYLFYQNSTSGLRAKLDTSDILLRDDVVGANAITLKSPVSLAAAYDFRFPNALPVANRVLQISSTGDVDPVLITDSLVSPEALTGASIADASITVDKFAPLTAVTQLYKETFTANGTWTRPSYVDNVIVRIIGGGGGGGGGAGGDVALPVSAASGGSGARINTVVLPVSGASYTVTVGAGGAGGTGGNANADDSTNGSNGGDSIFSGTGVTYTAKGGTGGLRGLINSGVSAGVGGLVSLFNSTHKSGQSGTGTTTGVAGTNGSAGESSEFAAGGTFGLGGDAFGGIAGGGGGGGGASLGAGGAGGNGSGGTQTSTAGAAGSNYGAGGGGGGGAASAGAADPGKNGGAGAPGLVEIYYSLKNA